MAFFADKARVMRELRDWAVWLKETRPDVERIGLFGSYATDTYGPPWITHVLTEVVWL